MSQENSPAGEALGIPRGGNGSLPHVVIVGGGFGGLYAAKMLGNQPVRVTLIDKRNFHLFQPLLYQIATGSLSPSDIASPLRAVLNRFANIRVLMDEVVDIDDTQGVVRLKSESVPLAYDYLIVATGSQPFYFGQAHWAEHAHGLKTVEDALDLRRMIFASFEMAEEELDEKRREALMSFVIIGGGPTGVELAGALAQIAHGSLVRDFRRIDCTSTKIFLVERASRLLGVYPESLSEEARHRLERLGVTVLTDTAVTDIQEDGILLTPVGQPPESSYRVETPNMIWAAGVRASDVGTLLADRLNCTLDRGGRVVVEPDLSIPQHPHVLVIGDLANYAHTPAGKPLPGVAPVAMQEGRYAAQVILGQVKGQAVPPFRYKDQGDLAVIGMLSAVADLRHIQLKGLVAWLIWALVHILYLIEFDNQFLVMFQWAWALITQRPGSRLITQRSADA